MENKDKKREDLERDLRKLTNMVMALEARVSKLERELNRVKADNESIVSHLRRNS